MPSSFADQAGGAVARIMAAISRMERAERMVYVCVALSALALYRTRKRR